MNDAFFWSTFGLVWIFGWVFVFYLFRRAEQNRSLKLREILHRERMTAIEKGVPLPEIPLDEELGQSVLTPEADSVRAAWLRRLALILGLTAVFTGIGMCVGFYFAPDRGFNDMWTLGAIPALGGIGLLLYAFLAARSVDSSAS